MEQTRRELVTPVVEALPHTRAALPIGSGFAGWILWKGVLEFGAGTGINLRYFRPGTRVIAVEPNIQMHPTLERNARRRGLELEIHAEGAEQINLPDDSVDAVVCSLVLCSVDDPVAAVREARRVLRPGGRFICIEHVAAESGTLLGRVQRLVLRPWQWLFDGCHTHRDTASVLEIAGFSDVRVNPFTWRSIAVPVRSQIWAVCTK